MVESQIDKVNVVKVRGGKEQYILDPAFNTDIPPIFGGIVEGKERFTPFNELSTSELWNTYDGVRGVYLGRQNIFSII